jgi:hypothetical protein
VFLDSPPGTIAAVENRKSRAGIVTVGKCVTRDARAQAIEVLLFDVGGVFSGIATMLQWLGDGVTEEDIWRVCRVAPRVWTNQGAIYDPKADTWTLVNFYSRTHDHSSMAVASHGLVSTHFDVPRVQETGPSELVVVANGIPSQPVPVFVRGDDRKTD